MSLYSHFWHGIKAIKFSTSQGLAIEKYLYKALNDELIAEIETLAKAINSLPEKYEDEIANKHLANHKQKKTDQRGQLESTLAKCQSKLLDLDNNADLEDFYFISGFADNFRNLKHIAEVLSDAPQAIKKHQTDFYLQVLSRLPKAEQEIQVKQLNKQQLYQLIKLVGKEYDLVGGEPVHKDKCQQLVQMAYFEIISSAHKQNSDINYINNALDETQLRVGKSSILDNFSDYRNADNKAVIEFLPLDITNADNFQTRSQVCQKLKFGQADRREFVERRQANLAKDLFWARDIKEQELFSNSKEAQLGLQQMGLNAIADDPSENYKLLNDIPTKSALIKTKIPKQRQLKKIIQVFKDVIDNKKVLFRAYENKTSDFKALKSKDAIKDVKKAINDILKQSMQQPILLSSGQPIQIEFFKYKDRKSKSFLIEVICNAMQKMGGLGRTYDNKSIGEFINYVDFTVQEQVTSEILRGESLEEIKETIKAKIDNLKEQKEETTPYDKMIKQIDKLITKANFIDFDNLDLALEQEIQLKKLFELYSIKDNACMDDFDNEFFKPMFVSLAKAYNNQAVIEEVLNNPSLSKALSETYDSLSKLSVESIGDDTKLLVIVDKAKVITRSQKQRELGLAKLNSVLNKDILTSMAVEDVFLEEYTQMASTLGIEATDNRLVDGIHNMAEEYVELANATRQGLSPIKPAEQQAYLQIIESVSQALPEDVDFKDIQFKVQYDSTGNLNVEVRDLNGEILKTVECDIGLTQLTYSLIKPPGSNDVVFTYGGARGIVAPFAGMDVSMAGRRFFTGGRLLGVGQYGAVEEVQSVFSGLNSVLKSGFVKSIDGSPTFNEKASKDLRTRPITARDDPLYRVESDILKMLSDKAKASTQIGTQYWLQSMTVDEPGKLYTRGGKHTTYKILQSRAKGETYADTANKQLNLYSKTSPEYHVLPNNNLDNILALSEALVEKAEKFHQQGFSHNDIKPENFLYKSMPDGTVEVEYIDWATGGVKQTLDSAGTKTAAQIFRDIYGDDAIPNAAFGNQQDIAVFKEIYKSIHGNEPAVDRIPDVNTKYCQDQNGRFVIINADNTVSYGITPTLQILHGAHNGTLPYISPQVLNGNVDKDTILSPTEVSMDDWALTAMIFGVCNKEAYFKLVKGRRIVDYIIPGVLASDNDDPEGLEIIDENKFNKLFACQNNSEVMFIPSNKSEGAPLHLFRRLQDLKNKLENTNQVDVGLSVNKDGSVEVAMTMEPGNEQLEVIANMQAILNVVHESVKKGVGLSKPELAKQIKAAKKCLEAANNLDNKEHLQARAEQESLKYVIDNCKQTTPSSPTVLLVAFKEQRQLEILTKLPKSESEKAAVADILKTAFTEPNHLRQVVFDKPTVYKNLFKDLIASKQGASIAVLLGQINQTNIDDFKHLITEQGLLHYALEQGLTEVFNDLIQALSKNDVSNKDIQELLVKVYEPAAQQSHLHWYSNCLSAAIRNENQTALTLLLEKIDENIVNYTPLLIKQALHQSSLLGNLDFYKQILEHAQENLKIDLNSAEILQIIQPPDYVSPYHHFLKDLHSTEYVIAELAEQPELIDDFYLKAPAGTHQHPLLIAYQNHNHAGFVFLLKLALANIQQPKQRAELFIQHDGFGKNIINHILEQGNSQHLDQLLMDIKNNCSQQAPFVIRSLLSNIRPLNPIENILSSNVGLSAVDEISRVEKLLNNIVSSPAPANSEALQISRASLIMLNSSQWLKLANEGDADVNAALKQLFRSDALSYQQKAALLTNLLDEVKVQAAGSAAHTLFETLYNEASQHVDENQAEQISIIKDNIFLRAEILKDHIDPYSIENQELIKTIQELRAEKNELAGRLVNFDGIQSELRQLKEQLTQQKSLEQKVNALQEELTNLGNELEFSSQAAKDADKVLEKTQLKLAESSASLATLKDEIVAQDKYHQIALKDSTGDKEVLVEKHAAEMTQLESELQGSQADVAGLEESLAGQGQSLTERQAQVEKLGGDLAALKEAHALLTQRAVVSEQGNEQLNEQLLEQSEKLEVSVNEAQVLVKKLAATQDELTENQSQLAKLSQTNNLLQAQVGELGAEVSNLQSSLTQVSHALSDSQQVATDASKALEKTQSKLAESSASLDALKNEIVEKEKLHQEALQSVAGDKAGLVAAHAAKMEIINEQLSESQTTVSQLRAELTSQGESLAVSQEQVESLEVELGALQEAHAALTDRASASFQENEPLHA